MGVQVPKYANTPFGRQVVGMGEKEQESRERCREVPVVIKDLRVPKGAKDGSNLKFISDIGHQTPGKIPGRIVLKVQQGSANDTYTIAETDLYTVLHVTLEQALFGFSLSWKHLGEETLTISRERPSRPDEVMCLKKKGLVGDGGQRGDLYVRLAVDLPQAVPGKSLTLSAAPATATEPMREKEGNIMISDGTAFRAWQAREQATLVKTGAKDG